MPYYHLGLKEGSACDTLGKLNSETIKVFPNPVRTELTVFLPLAKNSEVQTTVYSISGQRLLSQYNCLNYLQEYPIDIQALAKGLYFLRIESHGRVWKEKIIKE